MQTDAPQIRLALAERSVPRYTSYPTAPHFDAAIDAATYRGWLASLAPDATLSLYLHVPFCRELCHYCGCHTKAIRRPEPVAAYAAVLADEIRLIAALSGSRRVTHIHWGGGTPSILTEQALRELAETLDACFDLSGLRDHAIELDPRYVTPWLAAVLVEIGVTRASLGVQDLSPDVQAAIGRVQPFELVRHAVACLRDAGIDSLNLDLMYGLPKQSAEGVRRSAELAASLRPQRLALFGYAHVPWFKPHQRLIDDAALPATEERLRQAQTAQETLEACGYQAIGLDHFALPRDDLAVAARSGRLRRNFQGYTTDCADALLGFGASAIGSLPQGYVQNARDVGGYSAAVAAGMPATARGLALTDEDRLRASIIERLMCDFRVDVGTYADRLRSHRLDMAPELEALAGLATQGLVALDDRRVSITDAGRPFARVVASVFDTYLRTPAARHSTAV